MSRLKVVAKIEVTPVNVETKRGFYSKRVCLFHSNLHVFFSKESERVQVTTVYVHGGPKSEQSSAMLMLTMPLSRLNIVIQQLVQ